MMGDSDCQRSAPGMAAATRPFNRVCSVPQPVASIDGINTTVPAADEIVLVLLWHLGDVLNATALLPALTEKHQRKITFATTRACARILENNSCIKRIIAFDIDLPAKLTFGHFDQVAGLIRRHFWGVETVYNLHVPIDLRRVNCHIVECWAKIVGVAIDADRLRPSYNPSPPGDPHFVFDEYFVLANGGTSDIKHWHPSKWAMLVHLMKSKFRRLKLVQLGSSTDPLIDGVIDLRGRTSLAESYHLLRDARGCLSNDSLLSHLSSIAECPTYTVYGTHDPLLVRPLGKAPAVTFAGQLPCSPCYRDWCMLSVGLTSCLAHASAHKVFTRIEHDLETSVNPRIVNRHA
jgi:ADP-heptose:LPS heptosyltransferase